MNTEVDLQELVPGLHRLRIPGERAVMLNCYLWLGSDGVTVVDTGWVGSEDLIARALRRLGRRPEDVERVVLTHFHDDHAGSAAAIASWSGSTVVTGAPDASFVRGLRPGPWPTLTEAERALDPPMPGTLAPPPPCRVDHEARDGDELDFAGGAVVLAVPGHTPGSIAVHLPRHRALLVGDVVANTHGRVIVGVFNTDRDQLHRSIRRLGKLQPHILGVGHGDPVLGDVAAQLADCPDPLG